MCWTDNVCAQDGDQVSDSDNTSSVATAQMPVPLQRSSIRRNEYVNIPIPQKVTTTFKLFSPSERFHQHHFSYWVVLCFLRVLLLFLFLAQFCCAFSFLLRHSSNLQSLKNTPKRSSDLCSGVFGVLKTFSLKAINPCCSFDGINIAF
jgi:hypothetical protein